MIDPKTLELIQQEIDGENSSEESAELRARLRDDEPARQAQRELTRVASDLESVPALPPPSGLPQTILDKLRQRNVSPFPTARTLRSAGERRSIARAAFAAAAGLVLGLLLAPMVIDRRPELNSFEWVEAAGSMIRRSEVVATQTIAAPGAGGSATVRQFGEQVAIELDLALVEPALVALRFDPAHYSFEGVHRQAPSEGPVSVNAGELAMRSAGEERATVLLRRRSAAPQPFTLAIQSAQGTSEMEISVGDGP